jgi:hypothetical protein
MISRVQIHMECLGRSTDNIRTPSSPDVEASRVRPRVRESVGIVIEHSSSAGQLQADSKNVKDLHQRCPCDL